MRNALHILIRYYYSYQFEVYSIQLSKEIPIKVVTKSKFILIVATNNRE